MSALYFAGRMRLVGDSLRVLQAVLLWSAASVTVVCTQRSVAQAQQPVVVEAAVTQQPSSRLPILEELPPAMPQQRLGLTDLEQMALTANPSIIRASALVGAARGNQIQVGLAPNPTVGYEGQQLGSGGRAEQQGVLFSQGIVRGGKLRLNRAAAEQELARAQQELAVQQLRVLTDV